MMRSQCTSFLCVRVNYLTRSFGMNEWGFDSNGWKLDIMNEGVW